MNDEILTFGKIKTVTRIKFTCPHCLKIVNPKISRKYYKQSGSKEIVNDVECPNCNNTITVFKGYVNNKE